jgi:hypothetical protein
MLDMFTSAYLILLRNDYPAWDIGMDEYGAWLAITNPTPTSEISLTEHTLPELALRLDDMKIRGVPARKNQP